MYFIQIFKKIKFIKFKFDKFICIDSIKIGGTTKFKFTFKLFNLLPVLTNVNTY